MKSYFCCGLFSKSFLQVFPSENRVSLKWKIKISNRKITNLRREVLHFCAARKLQICAKFITNWRRYYKLAQKVLQICAAITNLRNYYKSAHNKLPVENSLWKWSKWTARYTRVSYVYYAGWFLIRLSKSLRNVFKYLSEMLP